MLDPAPRDLANAQLRRLGVPDDAYDATVTSGDLTRHELAKHGRVTVYHLGPERDLPLFDGLPVELGSPDEAKLIVCTGLFDDDTETPEDYVDRLRALAERKLPMICANPDHLVERGAKLVYCAGALASLYETFGGSVIYAGKPYAPIYRLALETLDKLAGRKLAKSDILAIGDGVNTDIAGAAKLGIDSVFVASGLHLPANSGGEVGEEALDREALAELFPDPRRRPLAAMPALLW
jgi:HAD superfamily hydrolase (TIGR01459 family)